MLILILMLLFDPKDFEMPLFTCKFKANFKMNMNKVKFIIYRMRGEK